MCTSQKKAAVDSSLKSKQLIIFRSQHPHYNTYQGLVFIQEYDLTDFDHFKTGLMQEYSLSDVVRASWIKPCNPLVAQPLLLTFRQDLPEYIDIPGEQSRTKVYEYLQKPMICSQCQEYGHTKKYCKSNIIICRWCNCQGHDIEHCNSL